MIILLFVQQKRKHSEMAFLTSRNANKHILFALGVDPTARDAVKAGIPTSEPHRQATPLAVETSIHSRYTGLESPASQDVN